MDETYSLPVDQQIRYYLYQLTSPLGLAAAMCFLGALVLIIWQDRAKWVALSLLIYIQTFGFFTQVTGITRLNTLAPPLQQLRDVGRPTALALVVLMLVPALRSFRGQRWRLIHVGTIALLVFELILASRFIIAGAYDKGLLGVIVYSILFAVLGFGLSRWLQGPREAHLAVKAVVAAGALLVLSTGYQFIFDRSALYTGNRLAGTTNNPQHLGTMLALCIPAAGYLLVRRGESMIWRVGSGCFLGFGLLFIIMSGSRLGILMVGTGLLLLFRARLGALAITLCTIGVVAMIGLQILGDSAVVGAEHLLTMTNSRAEVWQRGWQTFLDNMWIGTGSDADLVESSYISAGSEAGLLGAIPLLAATVLILAGMWRLNRLKGSLGPYALLADLVFAILFSVLVGSMFEGFLLSTMTDMLVIIYVFLALLALMIDPGPPLGEVSVEMTAGQEGVEHSSVENAEFSPGYVPAQHDPAYADSSYYN